MNIQNIFANGLPDELANLKSGQVVIFSSPEEGLSEQNIRISQYVSSVALHLKKNCDILVDAPAVFVVPTENHELWDSIACKIANPQAPIVELSDIGSLTEMLYDYWGLDFDKVLKPTIAKRYEAYHFYIGGHPSRLCIAPIKKAPSADSSAVEPDSYDFGSMSIDFIYAKGKEPTKNDISNKIQKILWEAHMYDVEIDYEKILKVFETEKKKSYTLDFDIEVNRYGIATKCDLILIDEKDEQYIVKLEAQEIAVYLAFMLFNDGEGIKQVDFDIKARKSRNEFLSLLDKIHGKMPKKNDTIKKGGLDKKTISEIRSRIKNKISKITMNPIYLQAFTIEGEKEGLFKIEASTKEIRSMIKDKLNLQ